MTWVTTVNNVDFRQNTVTHSHIFHLGKDGTLIFAKMEP